MLVHARRVAPAVAALTAVAILAIACGNGDAPTIAEDQATTTSTDTTVTSTTQQPVRRLTVTVAGGSVEGGPRREQIDLGKPVEITVNSDAADTLHVHGYDLTAEVKVGVPSGLTFTADIPGVFEVELEESGLKLLELEVR